MSVEIRNDKWKNLFEKQSSKTTTAITNEALIDSYYFIFDCSLNVISFMNAAFSTITGYSASTFTVEDLISNIHSDDQPYFFECEERTYNSRTICVLMSTLIICIVIPIACA